MAFCNWLLPLSIGIICTIFLMSILYTKPKPKIQRFTNLETKPQQKNQHSNIFNNFDTNPNVTYTTPGSILSVASPVYNYYPQTPLNP